MTDLCVIGLVFVKRVYNSTANSEHEKWNEWVATNHDMTETSLSCAIE